MKKKIFFITSAIVGFFLFYACSDKGNQNNIEKNAVLEIAKDTAIKKYGKDIVNNELPLVAILKYDSIWIVTGTLKNGFKGGTVYIEVLKSNKNVLKVTHYK